MPNPRKLGLTVFTFRWMAAAAVPLPAQETAHECALWLAEYADGQCRTTTSDGRRIVQQLPLQQWFLDLLQAEGGPDEAKRVLYGLGGGIHAPVPLGSAIDGFRLAGLVRVSNRNCCWEQGPLTQWHRESILQQYLHNAHTDIYDIHVESCCPVAQTTSLTHRCDRYQGRGAWPTSNPVNPCSWVIGALRTRPDQSFACPKT